MKDPKSTDQMTKEIEFRSDEEMEKGIMGLLGKIQGKGPWQHMIKGREITGVKPLVVLLYADQHYEYILPDIDATKKLNEWLNAEDHILPDKLELGMSQVEKQMEDYGSLQIDLQATSVTKKFTKEKHMFKECMSEDKSIEIEKFEESTSNMEAGEKTSKCSHKVYFDRIINNIENIAIVEKLKEFEKQMEKAKLQSESDWQFIGKQREGEDKVKEMWQAYIDVKTGRQYMSKGLQRQCEIKEKTTWTDYTLVNESKIYPALRKQLAEMDPPHKLKDLIDFRKKPEGYSVRLTEEHCAWIIRETAETRKNPVASKKHVCDAIQHFIKALQNYATDCINTQFQGEDARLESCHASYNRLLEKMKAPGNVLRLLSNEVRNPVAERERMPVEVALYKWSQSDDRRNLLDQLKNVYNYCKTGGKPTMKDYLSLHQFILEELQVSSPARPRAWIRLKVETILTKGRAGWEEGLLLDRSSAYLVTFPPAGIGCQHQQSARGNLSAGLINEEEAEKAANGSCDCFDKVRPSGYIYPNKGNKGAYKNRFLYLCLNQHKLLCEFLTIRKAFFISQNMDEQIIMGRAPLFLNSAGNKIDKVNLTYFNKAVGVEGNPTKFTPYSLRRFYTTWLNNHENSFVKAMRGEITASSVRQDVPRTALTGGRNTRREETRGKPSQGQQRQRL